MSPKFQDDRTTDLFGHPVSANHGKPGRPPLQINSEDRDIVEVGLARGWSNQRIANAIGISVPSLKRYFRSALRQRDVMRDKLELAANARTVRAAIEDGNMTAMKLLREMLDRDALMGRKRDLERQQQEAEAAGIGLGKKEAAQRAAEEAATNDGWGDLLNPDRMN